MIKIKDGKLNTEFLSTDARRELGDVWLKTLLACASNIDSFTSQDDAFAWADRAVNEYSKRFHLHYDYERVQH